MSLATQAEGSESHSGYPYFKSSHVTLKVDLNPFLSASCKDLVLVYPVYNAMTAVEVQTGFCCYRKCQVKSPEKYFILQNSRLCWEPRLPETTLDEWRKFWPHFLKIKLQDKILLITNY